MISYTPGYSKGRLFNKQRSSKAVYGKDERLAVARTSGFDNMF
ncbi:MAG: hypothetical protein ACQES4_11305 [Bacillota bacterium]